MTQLPERAENSSQLQRETNPENKGRYLYSTTASSHGHILRVVIAENHSLNKQQHKNQTRLLYHNQKARIFSVILLSK
jgi:flagellar basal body L-ring protein FlgH